MRSLICILSILLVMTARAAEPVRVVASVARVHEEGPPMKPGIYVDLVVHAPVEFQGLPITMFAAGASRRTRRAEFPIGAQFRLQLPDTAVAVLKKARADEDHIQSMIDDGVELEMISQLVRPAQIDLAELSAKPVRHQVR